MTTSARFCTICGKKITDPHRKKNCNDDCMQEGFARRNRIQRRAAEYGCLLPKYWLQCTICDELFPVFGSHIQTKSTCCPWWISGKDCGRQAIANGIRKTKKKTADTHEYKNLTGSEKAFRQTVCHRDNKPCRHYSKCSDGEMTGEKWKYETNGHKNCWEGNNDEICDRRLAFAAC